jgi:hypothetical protein
MNTPGIAGPHFAPEPRSPDTHPEIERRLIEGFRRMTGAQRLGIVRDLNRCAQRLQLAEIRSRYPHAGEYELWMRLASRTLSPAEMRRVYGWDPDVHGR